MRRLIKSLVVCSTAFAGLTMLRASDVPKVPENIRELMQDRKYEEAAAAIGGLLNDAAAAPTNADYLLYLKGRALHLAGKHREALDTFAQVERDYSESVWVRRAKFGQAAALLKLGDFEAAEHIYEEEVKFLLSTERKHEIASIYLEFADAYFNPPRKAGDGGAIAEKKPDYTKALNFYRQALSVGPRPDRRMEVEFRIARCQQELGQHAEAVASYQAFLGSHPQSPFDIEVRYQLGALQLALGQTVEARRTWKDLLDRQADHKLQVPNELLDAYPNRDSQRLAEAAYGISHTYGIPKPASKEDLELGVAAADRFVEHFPHIKLAARSSLEIAQSFANQNRHDEAGDRLKKLLEDPKYVGADVIPEARVLLGTVYQRQKRFAEAIAAWQEYLAKHASHAAWSQVQQAIIDTEFLTALEARRDGSRQSAVADRRKMYDDARRLWDAFLDRYPLDARAASIMLEFGLMHFELGELAATQAAAKEKADDPSALFDRAISDWTNLVSKYPATEESSRGQYLIGVALEEKLNKFDEALAAYRKLNWGQFAPRAAERINRLTRQELTIETERVFRTDQQPRIKVASRNIRQLHVKAYRVDLETYFRKMHLARGIESLDIALIDPEKSWTLEVPHYADYKQSSSYIDIPLDAPGVMAVTVANDVTGSAGAATNLPFTLRPQEATTMLMRSDLDILVKCSRNELFVLAENMRTGKPFAGVKLLVSDGAKVFAEGTTGEDGVFVGSPADGDKTWDLLQSSNDIRVFGVTASEKPATPAEGAAADAESAIRPAHVASSVIGLKGIEFAQGVSAKGYIYTERPTYRPGQLAHVRGVVRWVQGDQYFFEAGKKFKLDIYDSRGRQIRSQQVALGEFGSFAAHVVLPADAPQGEYRLHVHDPAEPDKHNYQGTFAVHEYQLQPVLIDVETPQKVYYRGNQISGLIKLRYYYGAPVIDREIRYILPDGTSHTARTNASGDVPFKFDTREFREDQTLSIVVQYPELNLQAGVNLFLATRGFTVAVATAREVFLSGETFDVTMTTTDAAGKKTGEKLNLAVVQRTEVQGQVGERTVQELAVTTDKDSGVGRATVRVAAAGSYVLRASGTDRFGNPVSAERVITVSGEDDTVRLRILSDKHHYKAGDTASVQVHWREEPALALITYQGARVLGYRLIELQQGTNKIEVPITENLAPNFDLTVSVMVDRTRPRPAGNEPPKEQLELPSYHEAASPFEVERPLLVTLKPSRQRVLPGEDVEVAVHVTDPQGKPVRAELSLAMIEKNLLDMFPERLSAITQFFAGTRRTSALRTVASCTFRYAPATHDISQTLIAEAERLIVADMERASRLMDETARLGARPRNGSVNAPLGDVTDSAFAIAEEGVTENAAFPPASTAAASFGIAPQDRSMSRGLAAGRAGGGGQGMQEMRKARVDLHVLESATAAGMQVEGGEPFVGVMEYAERDLWSKNAGASKDLQPRYFSDFDTDGLKAYAGTLIFRPDGKWGLKSTQLNLFYRDGSVNFVDARSVYAGKLADRAIRGGVTVLAEGLVRETGYWNPSILTDDSGDATVTITVPDRSTSWQVGARAITTGTLTGQTAIELTAKKDLFGELKVPLAFTDGDAAQIVATVHNDAIENGKIDVTLKSTIAGKSREEKRTIEVDKRGMHEVLFDRSIAGSGEAVFELVVSALGAPAPLNDSTREVVPIRPYGIPVFATTGGAASSNITAWLSPPAGMPVRDASLQIAVGPSIERSLLDVVLAPAARFGYLDCHRVISGESLVERTTSDLMAAIGLLRLIGETRDSGSPEAMALADRIRASIGYLVSSQNDDGGWHWSAARGTKQGSSDRNSSAMALWGFSLARNAGFAVPDDSFNKAITFVQTAFTAARENDYDGKSLLSHALASAGRGDFAYANRLYRSRTSLNSRALAYLALAFVEMDRKEIAREVLDILAPKLALAASGSSGPALAAGARLSRPTGAAEATEVRALYLLALNRISPADKSREAADWLMAHRTGSRWQPERATGAATLALAEYFATARFAAEHYKLKVFVNDNEVAELDMDGSTGSRIVEVPKEVLARGEKLPEKDFPGEARKQRINFELIGRGRFTFHCVYSGFVAADQLKNTVNAYHIDRSYEPAPLEMDGKEIPRGFDVLEGSYSVWRNPVTELPVGRRAQVRLFYYPINGHSIPEEEREYIVITEPIPSGCTVLEKSITGQFDRYEVGPGYITFYVGNRVDANEIRFDLYGYVAGTYRSAPTIVRNYYDAERMMVTQPRALTVVASGAKSKDEYRVTPRELYELGKRYVQKAHASRQAVPAERQAELAAYGQAARYLVELFDKFQLKPDIYKEVAQMLFETSLVGGKAPEIVRYFEVIKEKWPDLEITFEQIVQVGAAYRELNEYERSYLVFRATLEGSFTRESQIGGFLESQGESERSFSVMDRILREYPAEPYIASATYALAQRVYAMAPNAATDPKLRERKITKVDLIRDAVSRLDDFLTVWPDDPAADQASFSLASALVELEAWPAAIERSNRFAERFTKSEYLDSFWYIVGYAHFARGEHRAALDMCRRVAEVTHKDPVTGRAAESKNKWRAIYISGQVHHSLGEPGAAIAEYTRVADRFPDAKETIDYFTRKSIELPEITAVKPPGIAGAQGDPAADQPENKNARVEVELKFRNVASCEVKVYRIDLLKFGLLQRDLANITRINLAGIKPLYEAVVELGDGKDYRDRTKKLELPLREEGAYLVVTRGEDLHTSGLVLVTPLVVEVQEEASSGRVRATVKNSVTETYTSDVHVKVIGTRNDKFKDGATDLRGVFVADGILGRATVIARAGTGQYAFHRGQQDLGPPPAQPGKQQAPVAPSPAASEPGGAQQELLKEVFQGNRMIQEQKGKELQNLYDKKNFGVPAQQAF